MVGSSYLHIGEVGLEGVGAGVAGVEEHELGLLQVAGRQALLGVGMRPVKAFLPHWCVKAAESLMVMVLLVRPGWFKCGCGFIHI